MYLTSQSEYWKRGFQEVVSPNIYNSKLWEQSGHWQHYAVSVERGRGRVMVFNATFNNISVYIL